MRGYLTLPLFLLTATLSSWAAADLYQWKDASGEVHFSDKPPPGVVAKVIKGPSAAPAASSPESNRARDDANEVAERQKQALKHLEDARHKREEAEQKAAAQADQDAVRCSVARARQNVTSRGRVYDFDSNGERRYLSEQEVQERQSEANADIQQYCH